MDDLDEFTVLHLTLAPNGADICDNICDRRIDVALLRVFVLSCNTNPVVTLTTGHNAGHGANDRAVSHDSRTMSFRCDDMIWVGSKTNLSSVPKGTSWVPQKNASSLSRRSTDVCKTLALLEPPIKNIFAGGLGKRER